MQVSVEAVLKIFPKLESFDTFDCQRGRFEIV